MMTRPITTALALAATVVAAGDAQAQLFGNRSLGDSVSRRGRQADANVGTVTGNERFVRGNREGSSFVGTDSRESRNFVGSQNASPATSGSTLTAPVRIEQAPDANRATRASASRGPRGGLYRPRLAVSFSHPPLSSQQAATTRAQQVAALLARQLDSAFADRSRSIEVSLEGGKATLKGVVPSEHERSLAGLLALFEPGISEVENELVVKPPASRGREAGPASPRARAETLRVPSAPPRSDRPTPAGPD
jgi:osmotically-inducible protein OsmY